MKKGFVSDGIDRAAALAGNFEPAVLDLEDQDGISIRDAMVDFGLRPDGIKSRPPKYADHRLYRNAYRTRASTGC